MRFNPVQDAINKFALRMSILTERQNEDKNSRIISFKQVQNLFFIKNFKNKVASIFIFFGKKTNSVLVNSKKEIEQIYSINL